MAAGRGTRWRGTAVRHEDTRVTFEDRLDPALRPMLQALVASDLSGDIAATRPAARALAEKQWSVFPDVPEVEVVDHDADGVRVRTYSHRDRPAVTTALYWIHGGGMVGGFVESDDFMCKTWVRKLGCLVASVEYRLAPEHQYPAHVDDCYGGLEWFASAAGDLGFDRSRIVLGGASAGGGLAAAVALMARDRGDIALTHQMLVFPVLDDRCEPPSCGEILEPRVWNGTANRYAWRAYLGDRAGTDEVPIYAAPARATVDELRGLPPAYIDVGELDPFRDEDIAYAQKLLQAGVACELHVTPGAFHGSEGMVLDAPSSMLIRSYRRDFLRRALTG